MASDTIIKAFELSKKTKEAKQIRMFQVDEEILNSYSKFKEKLATIFGYPHVWINLFWKGR